MKQQQNPSGGRADRPQSRTSTTPRMPDHHHAPVDQPSTGGSHHGHRWMMLACCVPMLVIVAVLLATGTAGIGAVIFAVACVGIMTVMMLAMPRGH
ncbi:MAG: hypothetical protein BGO37_12855 [Cellulomonas sp. 73-92]|uniref:hypothetical protein n=1 Tax=Cellulomonas sp. 73-92 TaxID=1895740 RepID=UPI000928C271|nr:hypothetical protein [Cellulomonas sp. 73-92]OJV78720.1 MAG: hypothetical protein BGO37_12855 [Cellulomonas sp. 73-92]